MSLETHFQNELDRELRTGEKLLWSGQPLGGIRFAPADAVSIPFSLAWGGFAAFWEWNAIKMGAPLVFKLFGVPFVLFGMYLVIGRFFADARRRSRTVYGVTADRIIIISGSADRQIKSLPLNTITELDLSERPDGSGTITLGGSATAMAAVSMMAGASRSTPPRLDMVANVRDVYKRIRDAQAAPPPQ